MRINKSFQPLVAGVSAAILALVVTIPTHTMRADQDHTVTGKSGTVNKNDSIDYGDAEQTAGVTSYLGGGVIELSSPTFKPPGSRSFRQFRSTETYVDIELDASGTLPSRDVDSSSAIKISATITLSNAGAFPLQGEGNLQGGGGGTGGSGNGSHWSAKVGQATFQITGRGMGGYLDDTDVPKGKYLHFNAEQMIRFTAVKDPSDAPIDPNDLTWSTTSQGYFLTQTTGTTVDWWQYADVCSVVADDVRITLYYKGTLVDEFPLTIFRVDSLSGVLEPYSLGEFRSDVQPTDGDADKMKTELNNTIGTGGFKVREFVADFNQARQQAEKQGVIAEVSFSTKALDSKHKELWVRVKAGANAGDVNVLIERADKTWHREHMTVMAQPWRACPGGQTDANLNPTETFASADFGLDGNVDWTVDKGAVIVETNAATAQGRASISVRYSAVSASSQLADAVTITASKGGQTPTKRRTVFKVTLSGKFADNLDASNTLSFPAKTGTTRRALAFNWKGEDGAQVNAAKMELKAAIFPGGIDWAARGVKFEFTGGDPGPSYGCRLHRRHRVARAHSDALATLRLLQYNDWEVDGSPDPADAQYPSATSTDVAFRIDAPGVSGVEAFRRLATREDFKETMQWYTGTQWVHVTADYEWHVNETGEPTGQGGAIAKGQPTDHGPDFTTAKIPNQTPQAVASGPAQEQLNTKVELSAFGTSDADPDRLTSPSGASMNALGWEWVWTQTGGLAVTLTGPDKEKASFTPTQAGAYKFKVKAKDGTHKLGEYSPGNSEHESSEITVQVGN